MACTISYNTFSEVQALNLPSPEASIRVSWFLSELIRRQLINKYQDNGIYFSCKELVILLSKDNYLNTIRILLGAGLIYRVHEEGASVLKQYKDSRNRYGNQIHRYKTSLTPSENVLNIPKRFPDLQRSVESFIAFKKKDLSKAAQLQIPSLRRTRFVMGLSEMLKAAEANFPNYLEKKALKGKKPLALPEYLETIKQLHGQMMAFNEAITGPELYNFITSDSFSGRVHTLITSVPDFLREQAIQIDNKPVCELDMQAAGPTILGHILERCVPGNSFSSRIFSSEDIYKSMIGTMGIKDRNQAKQKMYSLLYGKVTSRGHMQFTKQYYDIGEWLYQIKTVKDPRNKSSKVHSNLARIVQHDEVKLFSEIWLQLKSKKILFNSIHDAILIPKRNKEQAHVLMAGVLSSHLRHFQIHS